MRNRDSIDGAASLFRAAGPNEGQEVKLNKERFLVGRSQIGNDLVLNDDEVSRSNADLVRGPDGVWTVEDHSASGTFVNGQRISRAILRPGCLLAFGSNKEMSFLFTTARVQEKQSPVNAPLGDGAAVVNCRLQLVLDRYAVRDIPLRLGTLYLGSRKSPDTFQVADANVASAHASVEVLR